MGDEMTPSSQRIYKSVGLLSHSIPSAPIQRMPVNEQASGSTKSEQSRSVTASPFRQAIPEPTRMGGES